MNLSENALGLLEDSLVREAEDGEAQNAQVESAILIVGNLLRILVNGPVELDDEPMPMAVEVGDIGADRDLTAELQAQETAIAEELPERFLGGCLRFAELAGAGGLTGGAQFRASSFGWRRRKTSPGERCCASGRSEREVGIGGGYQELFLEARLSPSQALTSRPPLPALRPPLPGRGGERPRGGGEEREFEREQEL
jgi:hypothetical protein